MKALITQIRREFWENKTNVLYTPMIIAAVLVLLTFLVTNEDNSITLNMLSHLGVGLSLVVMPLVLAIFLPLAIINYALTCLYEERKNKSLLFWRSMPISDTKTVLSKVLFGVIIVPVLFIVIWFIVTVVSILIQSVTTEIIGEAVKTTFSKTADNGFLNLFGVMLSLGVGLLIFSIMMLPYYAYLTFISAISTRTPIALAVIPIIVLVVLTQYFSSLTEIINYLKLPAELAVQSAIEATRLTLEGTGTIESFAKDAGFSMQEYRDFVEQGYQYHKTWKENNVSITRDVEVNPLKMAYSIRDLWILLGSIASSIGFITLAIFARKRVQSV